MPIMNTTTDVVIVGAGAAGMLAAAIAAQGGLRVLLLDKNERNGKKLAITGKGRCNVTNACTTEEVLKNIPCNSKFLYSALSRFTPQDVMAFFEDHGCALKIERGNRVFPESDRSADIITALERAMKTYQVCRKTARVISLFAHNGRISAVKTTEGIISAKRVILCTGGLSYPLTGSTGDGYAMAQSLGHTLVTPTGSLVPLISQDDCTKMQGLSLRNTKLRLINAKGKILFEDFGELLFTHFGLSGPTVLSASAHMKKEDAYTVELDLKPALDEQKLDARFLRDFEKYANRSMENALCDLYPTSMIPVILSRCMIDPQMKANSLTKPQRRALLEQTKHFRIRIDGLRPVDEAIITRGGISVKQVDPKTMQSKLIEGLYFAGEILDCDAYTGGFNLQIAWSTAFCAASACVHSLSD